MRLFPAMLLAAFAAMGPVCAQEAPRPLPGPVLDDSREAGTARTAVLAGGCYWGMQGLFEHVRGVTGVVAGFSGMPQMGNEDDILGRSGHKPTEAVQITYDPKQISYGEILQIFFSAAHDPTEVDRQGPDVGPQYRSAIFYSDAGQRKIAEAYIAQLQAARAYTAPLATAVEPLIRFRAVDDSQQDYVLRHPTSAYVLNIDEPKLAALAHIFPAVYMEKPLTYSKNPAG